MRKVLLSFQYKIVLKIAQPIQKKTGETSGGWNEIILIFSLGLILPATCISSVVLEIGAAEPKPWFTPKPSNIVGKWQYSSNSAKSFEYWTSSIIPEHELVFNKDGTFYVYGVPSFWTSMDDYEARGAETITGTGTWHLGQTESDQKWVVFLEFETINGEDDKHEMLFFVQGHVSPILF